MDAKYNKGRPPGRAASCPPNRSCCTVPHPPGRDKPAAGSSDRCLRPSPPHFPAPWLRFLENVPPSPAAATGANRTAPGLGERPAEPPAGKPVGVQLSVGPPPSPQFSVGRGSGEKRGRRFRDTKGLIRAKTSSRPNVPAPTKVGLRWYSCFKTWMYTSAKGVVAVVEHCFS